jgi:hypothetical protein
MPPAAIDIAPKQTFFGRTWRSVVAAPTLAERFRYAVSSMKIAVIEAPSILGLKPTGVEGLARSLMTDGVADRLDARHVGRIEPPLECRPRGAPGVDEALR